MRVQESNFFKEFCELCENGYVHGWHERNGGNLSYRIRMQEVELIRSNFVTNVPYVDIGTTVPKLANCYFLVTGSGKFMKNVLRHPEENIGIIQISPDGKQYKKVWGLVGDTIPTSELPTHLKNHEVRMLDTKGKQRIVYHCHPTNLIALTYVLPLDSNKFTRALWEMSTECSIVFPNGIGVLPWMVPGQEEIAIESAKMMKKYDAVVWPFHGIFVAGETFDSTWGLVETIEKASAILVKVLSMTDKPKQSITTEDLLALEEPFKVSLNKEVLYANDKDK